MNDQTEPSTPPTPDMLTEVRRRVWQGIIDGFLASAPPILEGLDFGPLEVKWETPQQKNPSGYLYLEKSGEGEGAPYAFVRLPEIPDRDSAALALGILVGRWVSVQPE